MSYLVDLESQFVDLSAAKVPSRLFKLPILFDSHRQTAAIERYMETQRPYASYLPDNMEFVAKNNGLQRKDLEYILLNSKLMAISVGFFAGLPLCLPVDPRHRMNCPKVKAHLNGFNWQSFAALSCPLPLDESVSSLHTRRASFLGRLLHGYIQH